jgi:hypothetical protein
MLNTPTPTNTLTRYFAENHKDEMTDGQAEMLYVLPILTFKKGRTTLFYIHYQFALSVKTGLGYSVQIYLVQIYGISI